jgi:CBS domain-containing protein
LALIYQNEHKFLLKKVKEILNIPVRLESIVKKPITVSPSMGILGVRDILIRHNIGRVIVQINKKPIGIITEKDVTRAASIFSQSPIAKINTSDIMSKDLITVDTSSSIFECARLMMKNDISSIIVVGKNRELVGVVTKTDLVSVFLIESTASLTISKAMTKKVITVDPEDSIYLVQSVLINNKISRVVVAKNKTPIGIITYRDFVPAKTLDLQRQVDPNEVREIGWNSRLNEFNVNRLSYLLTFSAKDIMTTNPLVVNSNDALYTAAILMIRHGISGIPVVRGRTLVGIITKSDIVKVIADAKSSKK